MKTLTLKTIVSILEWLKKKIEKPKPNSKVSHLRTDKNGNAFYAYRIQDLPSSRSIYFQSILNMMGLGIDKEQLHQLLEKAASIVHSANSSNLDASKSNLIYQFENIKERSENIVNTILLEKAALVILCLEGEPEEITQEWIKKKQLLLSQDEDSKVFFWSFVLNLVRDTANTSPTELKNYLLAKGKLTI